MKDQKTIDRELDSIYKSLDQYYQRGDVQGIEDYLLGEERRIIEEGGSKGVLVTVYNELGSFYRSTSRYSQSIDAFDKAGREISASLGTHCAEYATLVNNLAGTYRLAGQHEKAIGLFHQAIRTYREAGEDQSYAFASVQNNISLAYQEIGKGQLAIRHLEQALEILGELPGHVHEVAITYSNLAALYYKNGHNAEAMTCLDRALYIFESCDQTENPHYAAALNSLGGILFATGEYQRAVDTYQKAAAYTRRFFGENLDFAISHQNMCWVYRKMGDMASAIEALSVAERIYRTIFGPDHERTRTVQDELRRMKGAMVS